MLIGGGLIVHHAGFALIPFAVLAGAIALIVASSHRRIVLSSEGLAIHTLGKKRFHPWHGFDSISTRDVQSDLYADPPPVYLSNRVTGFLYVYGPLHGGTQHLPMHYLLDEAGRPVLRITSFMARRRELVTLIRRHLPPRPPRQVRRRGR